MELGSVIKSLRRRQGLTLAQLADRTNLSKSFLSQVESDTAQPSIASLKTICAQLGVSLGDLFREDGEIADAPPRPPEPRNRSEVRVVRKNGRKALQLPGSDSIHFLLTPDLKRKLEVILAVMQPGENMESDAWQHEGEEFGLILEGRYELTVDGEVYVLEEGDSIYYPSHLPHSAKVIGNTPTKWIWVITPPSF
jgi:transcriptional regulator with XRE-family HTH domain